MKVFVAIVINLVVLVQLSQSHTIKPTIVIAEPDVDNDDDLAPVNQDDDVVAEANPYKTCNIPFLFNSFEMRNFGTVEMTETFFR